MKELLADGTVQRVLGWKQGDLGYNPEPHYFNSAEELDEFIYDGFKGYMYDMSDIFKGGTTVPAYVASTQKAVTTYYEGIRKLFYED